MDPGEQARGALWVPALLAPVVLLAALVTAGALNDQLLGGGTGAGDPDAPLWRWLLEADNAFWGPAPLSTAADARPLIATSASALVMLLTGGAGTLLALRGLAVGVRARGAAFTAFLSVWAVLTVTTVAGSAVWWLALNRGRLGSSGAGQTQFAVLTSGLQYGAKYGWLGALLATCAWLLVRQAAARPAVTDDAADPGGPPDAERDDRSAGPTSGEPAGAPIPAPRLGDAGRHQRAHR